MERMKKQRDYKTEPSTIERIFEIHETNAINESGERPVIIKKEEEAKKIKTRSAF